MCCCVTPAATHSRRFRHESDGFLVYIAIATRKTKKNETTVNFIAFDRDGGSFEDEGPESKDTAPFDRVLWPVWSISFADKQ